MRGRSCPTSGDRVFCSNGCYACHLNGSLKGFEPHQLSAEELPRRLQVDPLGALDREAVRRLTEQGPNELADLRQSLEPSFGTSSRPLWCWCSWPPRRFPLRSTMRTPSHIGHRVLERGFGLCRGIPGRESDGCPQKTRRVERYGATGRSANYICVTSRMATCFIWRRVIWSEPTAGSLRQKA